MLRSKNITTLIVCVFILALCSSYKTPVMATDYDMQCFYIYKFAQYTTWPKQHEHKPIKIGFVGNSPILAPFTDYIAEKNKSELLVTQINSISTANEATDYDMLYISQDESKNISLYLQKLKDKPVLVITEQEGMIKLGACINLIYKKGSSIQVQINTAAFNDHKLKTTPDLIKLANEVVSI
jgi:hypothetical protein